ncbi:MAG: VOC family protein [Candidatus Cyclobacteriaceae bacterium M2_1C_046]
MMEQRITIITLGVTNLSRSESFYSDILGWTKTQDSNENIIFYNLNGILLSLYPKNKLAEDAGIINTEDGFNGFSLSYNTRTEEEADALFYKLKEADVAIVKLPEKVFWGGYSGYIADPDGNLIEIAYNPHLTITETGSVK